MATSFVQNFIRGFIASFGLKRKLSAAFQTLALIIFQVPQLAPFAGVLSAIAGWLGLAGLAHAGAKAEVSPDKAVPLPLTSIAAFFNALVLAADSVPQLAPYRSLFLFIASILSVFSTTSTVVGLTTKDK